MPSQPTNTPTTEQAEPSAKEVAAIAAVLVDKLQPLPPQLQLRALQAAATMLGIDKTERGRASAPTNQQRNQQQQRSGGGNR